MNTDDRNGPGATLPRLAVAILRHRLPRADAEFFLGDLYEGAEYLRAEGHAVRANLWIWRETLLALFQRWPRPRSVSPGFPPQEGPMKSFVEDLRFAVRIIRRAPAMSAMTIATLALGIGAATAIFSVINPALLEPLPYPRPEQLVMLWDRDQDARPMNMGYLTFRDLERGTRTLESAAAVGEWQPILTSEAESERLSGQRVTQRFFHTLGVAPALGHDFLPEEDRPEANRVVMLSYSLWQRRFGGDSGIVGRMIPMNGVTYRVAGVLPRSFESIAEPGVEIWRPLGYEASVASACRTCRHLRVVARVRDGVKRGAAQAELSRLSAAIVRDFPNDYPAVGVVVQPMQEMATQAARPALLALAAAVAFVLLIACVNAANLLLGRALRRGPEYAVRTALGAGRGRIVRLVVAESLVLAVAAAALGTALAFVAVKWLLYLGPQGIPRLADVGIDGTVLGFALLAAVVTGIAAGAAPALAVVRAPLHGVLKTSGRGVSSAPHRLRSALVVAEVAIAVSLLAGATLLFKSLGRLLAVDTGFDSQHVLSMEVQVTGPRYPDDAAVRQFWTNAIEAVRAQPGVTAVGVVSLLPLGGNFDMYGVHLEDRPSANPELDPSAFRYGVSPGYLTTMGIPLLRGRGILPSDGPESPFVVVINRALAEGLFPGSDPLNRRFRVGGNEGPWRTIVGVVDNSRQQGLDEPPEYQMYLPLTQWWGETGMTLVVKTAGAPSSSAGAVRDAVRSIDRSAAITRVVTMEDLVARSTAQRRFALALFQAFALIALLLAAAGIYGVLSAGVAERTREIGIRSALGAPRERILSMVVRQGLSLTSVGLVLGMAGAFALSKVLATLLFEVRSSDPATLFIVAATLIAIAIVACVLPALRAARVDPATVLRE